MRRALFILVPLLVVSTLAAQEEARPPVTVTYSLDVMEPKSGAVKIEMLVENNRDDEVTIGILTWAPGSYRSVSYFLAIHDLEAEVAGQKGRGDATEHKSLWKVVRPAARRRSRSGTCEQAGRRPQLRNNLTEDHYDLQGPSAWLFVLDRMDGPHKVTFKRPVGWNVGTGLTKLGEATYGARDYDTFIDCPIELGKFSLQTFEHDGVTYEIVLHATEPFEVAKLVDVIRKIVSEQMRMFGGAPFDRCASSSPRFGTSPAARTRTSQLPTHITFRMGRIRGRSDQRRQHHVARVFHLWNVKRIRPEGTRAVRLRSPSGQGLVAVRGR
jgi:predicted metalloprotease with PDZ domain